MAPLEPHALAYDKPRCASLHGFTLHADTRAGAQDASGREALLRYVLRPPLAQERLEPRPDGLVRIVLRRDGALPGRGRANVPGCDRGAEGPGSRAATPRLCCAPNRSRHRVGDPVGRPWTRQRPAAWDPRAKEWLLAVLAAALVWTLPLVGPHAAFLVGPSLWRGLSRDGANDRFWLGLAGGLAAHLAQAGLLWLLRRSVGNARAVWRPTRIVADGDRGRSTALIALRRVRSAPPGGLRGAYPATCADRTAPSSVPRYSTRGYSSAPPPRPPPSSSSESTCRRRTRLFQYGGPRPGERRGTSGASPAASRVRAS